MSIAVQPQTKKKMKSVSWAKQWAWKEGEEEQTQSKRLAWKKKRKRRGGTMNRTEVETEEYKAMQTRWMFHILKDQACAKYIIFACMNTRGILFLVQHFLQNVDITLDKQALPEALKQFRDDNTITLDRIMGDDYTKEALYFLWRAKDVRKHFSSPQDLSSTDTDASERIRVAARAVEDKEVIDGYEGLSKELQRLVANFTSRYNPESDKAAREVINKDWGFGGTRSESDAPTVHPASSHETIGPGSSYEKTTPEKTPTEKTPTEKTTPEKTSPKKKRPRFDMAL